MKKKQMIVLYEIDTCCYCVKVKYFRLFLTQDRHEFSPGCVNSWLRSVKKCCVKTSI